MRGKPFSEHDKAYICKFYDMDGPTTIALAMDAADKSIIAVYSRLEKQGQVEYYKDMWERQYMEINNVGWF